MPEKEISEHVKRAAESMGALARSLEIFNDAVEYAVWEWPDVVLEDILDAEFIDG